MESVKRLKAYNDTYKCTFIVRNNCLTKDDHTDVLCNGQVRIAGSIIEKFMLDLLVTRYSAIQVVVSATQLLSKYTEHISTLC
jgi:hypothetical protein